MGTARESDIPFREGASFSYESIKYWNHFVDFTTIIWLSAFMVSLIGSDLGFIIVDSNILFIADTITLFTLPIFVADLAIKFYSYGQSKVFFKKHWISLLMVVPYFRIFKILKLVKVMGLVRLSSIPKAIKSFLNLIRMIFRVFNFYKR